MAETVKLLSEAKLALDEDMAVRCDEGVNASDVVQYVAIARWAARAYETLRLHVGNENDRLAITKMFAEHAITREAWIDHGTATDRMRKALEKEMEKLLAELTPPTPEERR